MPSAGTAAKILSENGFSCDHSQELAAGELDKICAMIAAGRIAARELAVGVRGLGLSETQVRLLWALRSTKLAEKASQAPLDQTRLAAELGLSAAQTSSMVDRMRRQGAVISQSFPGDRRRQIWQLTAAGLELTQRIVTHLAAPRNPRPSSDQPDALSTPEAA